MGVWIAGCKTSGFDAVGIDNLDSYSRSNNLLTQDDNVTTMRLLANAAHAMGTAIAQENSTELLERVPDMQTDLAVAEECNRWDECDDYRTVYGDPVFAIEYRQQDFDAGCRDYDPLDGVETSRSRRTMLRPGNVYDGC